jgi:signal transduction histidine kinase
VRIDVRPTGSQGALWRALIVFRAASLVFVAVQVGRSYADYAHPLGAVTALAAMAVWSVFVCIVQPMLPVFPRAGGWRPRWSAVAMVAADLAVAVAALLATRLVDTHERVVTGAPTLPGTWTAAAVLGAAIAGGAPLGLVVAVVLSAALVVERGSFATTTTSSATLLVLAGVVVGYLATTTLKAEEQFAQVRALEAARAERDRLARAIHDGALQALALIARDAAVMDRDAIASLATEHETALRSHVTALVRDSTVSSIADVDLRTLLTPLETTWPHRAITLAMPAEPVLLTGHVAVDMAAAVKAALDNVDRHAGPSASAWVLVEDEGDAVVVSVRDDGCGMASDRADEARAVGRIGIAGSIVGRLASLGGSATVTSAVDDGVEVELRVPRR